MIVYRETPKTKGTKFQLLKLDLSKKEPKRERNLKKKTRLDIK